MTGVWLAASVLFGRPVPVSQPYPCVCGTEAGCERKRNPTHCWCWGAHRQPEPFAQKMLRRPRGTSVEEGSNVTITIAPNQDNEIVHCQRCDRKLRGKKSKERGIGPVCERKQGAGQ